MPTKAELESENERLVAEIASLRKTVASLAKSQTQADDDQSQSAPDPSKSPWAAFIHLIAPLPNWLRVLLLLAVLLGVSLAALYAVNPDILTGSTPTAVAPPVKGDVFANGTVRLLATETNESLGAQHRAVVAAIADSDLQKALQLSNQILHDHPASPRGNYNLAVVYTLLAKKSAADSRDATRNLDRAQSALRDALEYGMTNYLKLYLNQPKPVAWIRNDGDLAHLFSNRPGAIRLLETFALHDISKIAGADAGCVHPQMNILMTDGKQVPIASVRVGDSVVTYDVDSGARGRGRVVWKHSFQAEELLKINGRLLVTPAHPIQTDTGWLPAGELTIDSHLLLASGKYESIHSLEFLSGPVEVVDLTVEPTSTFVVEDVVVHNKVSGKLDYREQITYTRTPPFDAVFSLIVTRKDQSKHRATGVLIGPRLVLTSGAAIYRKDEGFPESVEVTPGRNGRESPFGSVNSSDFFVTDSWREQMTPDESLGAVLLPAPFEKVSPLEPHALPYADLRASLLHFFDYPMDKPFGTLWHGAEITNSVKQTAIRYRRKLTASSGAPLFLVDNTGSVFLVGVHFAGHSGVRLHGKNIDVVRDWIRESDNANAK